MLKQYAENSISDNMYERRDILFPINTPISKEHMLYRMIFEEVLNNKHKLISLILILICLSLFLISSGSKIIILNVAIIIFISLLYNNLS